MPLTLTPPALKNARRSLLAKRAGARLALSRAAASRAEDSRPTFDSWLREISPDFTWDWPHLEYVRAQIDRVTAGEIKKLMVFMPPRHGKSEQNTIRYPLYRLERDPTLRVAIWSYNQTLAKKFGRKVRKLALGRLTLSTERRAAEDWETSAGGGVCSAGVGVGIAGRGFDLILIDDPIKNAEEANSETYRDKVWDSYTDDLYTRMEPGGAVVLTLTRWHSDDLAGRILSSEDAPNWSVVSLPALAEDDDPLGREVGEALCPARYTKDALESIKSVMGSGFSALYQQRPVPEGGDFLKSIWFQPVDAAPADCPMIRYWDKAGTQGGGDWTAGVLMARRNDGIFYVVDVIRGQWSAGEREARIRQAAENDGRNVGVWLEQEPGSGGKESAQNTVINLAGWNVHAEPVTGDKVARARPLAAQAEAGNVRMVRDTPSRRWNAAFLDEVDVFPMGKHDDQVDGASGSFNKLALVPRPGASAVAGKRPTLTVPMMTPQRYGGFR